MERGRIIRTLHILDSLDRRGAETFAVHLADGLSRDAFMPAIWSIRPPEPARSLVPQQTPVLSPSAERRGRPVVYRTFRHLIDVLREHRPHLVQCHGGRALKYGVATKPFWRAGAYVYTKIGSVHPWLDHPVKRSLAGMLFEQTDAIVAVGERVRREVEVTFRPRRPRLLTITTGRDVSLYAGVTSEQVTQTRAELGVSDQEVCLMTVGSLSWEKNPQLLLRLFAQVLSDAPHTVLAFVGEGPLEPALRQQVARDGLDHRVRFLGLRSDVPRLLSAADIFVLSSVTEGLPGVLIEAGMAGLPGVAFAVGSVDDILKDAVTGFVVPVGDIETYRARLLLLVRDAPRRREMGRQALMLCRRDFDIRRSVQHYQTLFTTLLDSPLPRGSRSADAWT